MILGFPALPLAVHIRGYRRDDDYALDDVLVIDVDAEKGESTRHHAKAHHTDDGAPNAANSAGEARAADNRVMLEDPAQDFKEHRNADQDDRMPASADSLRFRFLSGGVDEPVAGPV
jgi:hypothetical protein